MKKVLKLSSAVALAVLISGCGVAFHNSQIATSVEVASVEVINLADDTEYAIPGGAGFHGENQWTNTYKATASEDGKVTFEFDPALEIANTGDAPFKVVKSGDWNTVPFNDEYQTTGNDNATVNWAEGLFEEGATYKLIWDASAATFEEVLTAEIAD